MEDEKLLVDWLMDDNLLELIAYRLDVMDYIRFRSVCKIWRSISVNPWRPLLPWLIMGCDQDDGRLFYISLTDDKLHSIVVPALKENKSVELGIVSCEGWLVLEGQENSYAISLLNPFTNAQVHLPEAPKQLFTRSIQYNMPYDPLRDPTNYTEIQYLIHQMAMSFDPSTDDCVIVVISAGNKALVSLRVGVDGSSWRLMNDESKYEDVVFFRRYFAAVNCLGEVSIFSGIDLNKLYTIPSPSINKADWKLSATNCLILFQKESDCEGYISLNDRKLPFYKTKRINTYNLRRDKSVGSPPLKFSGVKFWRGIPFYGISSPSYHFFQFFSGMPESIYMAGEHRMVDDDSLISSYVTSPQAYDINNHTLTPLFPQFQTNSILFWFAPRLGPTLKVCSEPLAKPNIKILAVS